MSIPTIVERAAALVEQMGGGEQHIGKTSELCPHRIKKKKADWIFDLAEALDEAGLTLVTGPGRPDDLYAKPRED